jgi:hypothetical protein
MLRTAAAAASLIRQFEDGYVKSCAAPDGTSRSAGSCSPADRRQWLRGFGQAAQQPRSLAHLWRQSSQVAMTVGPDRARPESLHARRFRIEILMHRLRRRFGLPPTAQSHPAVAQGPATDERGARNPPPLAGPAKIRQVVIGRRNLRQRGRRVTRPNKPESCESFEHRSPPLPRLARQAGERDGQLGATITPHAATAVAIDFDVLRQRGSDRRHRTGDAIGGTAHWLFVGVEWLVSNARSATIGKYAWPFPLSSLLAYPPGRIAVILTGG